MCLIVKQGCVPEIAQKDIKCWKSVYMDHIQKIWRPCVYTYTHAVFPLNKVATALDEYYEGITRLKVIRSLAFTNIISYGIHAKTCPRSSYNICVIPKGAEYCLGEYDEIVATKMIVFGTFVDYLWYKLKKSFKK